MLEHELETALGLAREASEIVMRYYHTGAEVKWKDIDDPVTVADHAASRLLVDRLSQAFPGDAVLSEEEADDGSRLRHERVWMIDPIDGTKQFIEGIGEFAIQIGLTIGGVPSLGVVCHAPRKRIFYAASGLGAFVEENWSTRRLRVSTEQQPNAMTVAMSRSHKSPIVDDILDRLGVGSRVSSGSVGLKMGMLAEGLAHIYLHPGQKTNVWDTCGPEAILCAAGGLVTDINGDPLQYGAEGVRNRHGVLASNGPIHERLIRTIHQVLREERGPDNRD